jgi:hypothetical protein
MTISALFIELDMTFIMKETKVEPTEEQPRGPVLENTTLLTIII